MKITKVAQPVQPTGFNAEEEELVRLIRSQYPELSRALQNKVSRQLIMQALAVFAGDPNKAKNLFVKLDQMEQASTPTG